MKQKGHESLGGVGKIKICAKASSRRERCKQATEVKVELRVPDREAPKTGTERLGRQNSFNSFPGSDGDVEPATAIKP